MIDYSCIIDQYYSDEPELRSLLLHHSRQVASRCLGILTRHPELDVDAAFVEAAAMLHDIGIRWCNAPSILCHGDQQYICHGIIGARLMRSLGMESVARVCERHTGTGITLQQIVSQQLPLPLADYTPVTEEEQLVCYADKFFSKSHPERVLTVEQAAASLQRFGQEGVERFLSWAERYE